MLLMDKSGSEDLVRARILQQTRVRTTKLITDLKTLMEQGTAVQERPKRRRDSLLPECEEEEEKQQEKMKIWKGDMSWLEVFGRKEARPLGLTQHRRSIGKLGTTSSGITTKLN